MNNHSHYFCDEHIYIYFLRLLYNENDAIWAAAGDNVMLALTVTLFTSDMVWREWRLNNEADMEEITF